MCIEDLWRNRTRTRPFDRVLYREMCIESFWRNKTETRPADTALYTGERALKTSGIGYRIHLLIGLSVEENVR